MTRIFSLPCLVGCVLLASCAPTGKVSRREPAPLPTFRPMSTAHPQPETPDVPKIKTPGEPVIEGVQALGLAGMTDAVELSRAELPAEPTRRAVQLRVTRATTNSWDVQAEALTRTPIAQGDVLLATFSMRTAWSPRESGEGQLELVFHVLGDRFAKAVSFSARAASQWQRFHVPFVAKQDHALGQAVLGLRLGFGPQVIELSELALHNFGKDTSLHQLPASRISYRGMEPNADWRRAAQARIEAHRKHDYTLRVVDAKGAPVAGAQLSVQLARHAFGFGTCVAAPTLISPGSDDDTYRSVVADRGLFNLVTLENNLKWVALEGDWGNSFTRDTAERALAWLSAANLPVRGHVLVWPGWKNLPKSLRALENQPARLRLAVKHHVAELAAAMRGKLVHWDVLNEPFTNHDLMDSLGDAVMVEWFATARQADPSAQLFINDFAILSGGGGTTPHRDHYDKTIAYLLDHGAPLDGIGLQGHFGSSLTDPEDLLTLLDRYARYGKPLYVTEFDVEIEDEQLAAAYLRDFYTVLFSHPAVHGIVMWGFWDGAHWKKNAPLYRNDWSEKPALAAYRQLLQHTWTTEAQGRTDSAGNFALRGFAGSYAVSVVSPTGQVLTGMQRLDAAKRAGQITLAAP